MAADKELPLAADKEESMVLRGGCGQTKNRRNGIAEKVRWLWFILDDRLDFKEDCGHRIGKARSLPWALGGAGNSKWGMSLVSWRAAYTGMVRAVASWGVEIGWGGQKEWSQEITLLQNAAMQKSFGAVKGSSGRKANAIVGWWMWRHLRKLRLEGSLRTPSVTPCELVLEWWMKGSL